MKRSLISMPAILLLLATLIVAPSIFSGYQNEKNARQALVAGEHFYAAQQFDLAAQRLFWRPELWSEAGDAYLKSGALDDTRAVYEHAAKQNALSACGWSTLGAIYAQNDPERALQTWQTGLSQHVDSFLLHLNIANEYRLRGEDRLEREYLLAAFDYEVSACDGSFNTARIHYRLGQLLMLDDPNRAFQELNNASRLDGQFAPVVETLRTSLNLASLESDPAEKLILLGRGLGLVGEWQLAASAFGNATQADPESVSAWAWLGESQYQLGENAMPAFEKAASIQPDAPTLLALRGLYLQRTNEFESALPDFAKLAELEPENPTWQTSLGALYAELGDLPTALAAYEKAIDLSPTEPVYRQLLALFSFHYQYDLAEIGLSAARRAVILAPDEAQYADTLGLVYFGLERDEDAQRQFLRALGLDADYAPAQLHLGTLYLKTGERDLAYAALLRAQELSQNGVVGADAARLLDEYFQK